MVELSYQRVISKYDIGKRGINNPGEPEQADSRMPVNLLW